jgi:chitosanase
LTEQTWIEAYVDVRRAWLAGHSNKLLHKTVYRMDAFKKLIGSASWDLALPFKVRGIVIDEDALTGSPPIRVSAGEPTERLLKLRQPFMRGADVESLQKGLSAAGIAVDTDGIFGPGTERAVIKFQKREGLTVDGVVGPATLAEILG